MKISVLTTTYNRCEELEKLYTSLVVNTQSGVDFEGLIMDDGSTDKTKVIVQNYIKQNIFHIEYYYQKNQGKMAAINNLMEHVNGDICFTCDSDDQLTVNCMDIIKKNASKLLDDETVYALLFLKKVNKKKISGNKFPENDHRSDMFSLYFREQITGEKILVFKTAIRKKYRHELEADEKFITEARMYHKMDLDNDVICINQAIEIGDYKNDGYTQNIKKTFVESPMGYFMYFKEILDMDLKDVTFDKKKYIFKQYILFANLAERDHAILMVNGLKRRLLLAILWIPGTIKTRRMFPREKDE